MKEYTVSIEYGSNGGTETLVAKAEDERDIIKFHDGIASLKDTSGYLWHFPITSFWAIRIKERESQEQE